MQRGLFHQIDTKVDVEVVANHKNNSISLVEVASNVVIRTVLVFPPESGVFESECHMEYVTCPAHQCGKTGCI